MPDTSRIGVLLTDETSGEKIGVIEFDPSGMLINRVFENTLHVHSLNPLVQAVVKEPLYVKYADLLEENSALSADILEEEAVSFAKNLNQREQPFTLGKYTIQAMTVRF